MSRASSVLPVPGSPLTSNGRPSATATSTARASSGETMYSEVPVKLCTARDDGTKAAALPKTSDHHVQPSIQFCAQF